MRSLPGRFWSLAFLVALVLAGCSPSGGTTSRGEPAAAHGLLAAVKWKFKGPIRLGDTIHVRSRIVGLKEGVEPGQQLVTVERQVMNQHGEVVQEGETEHVLGSRKP